jgi:hypothetical protein
MKRACNIAAGLSRFLTHHTAACQFNNPDFALKICPARTFIVQHDVPVHATTRLQYMHITRPCIPPGSMNEQSMWAALRRFIQGPCNA